ncbi:unnamed protein product [Vitrella brassicaformis CCMP3155]|uniref:t-SNARE coiled-coil homology domain-containing protein n=1 Tax=Vitrella brassicaformis (strain CCMP3155) TaxID=1169540 RepID=A0A0G4EKJ1_VITBC|nr:unnamed protein product [Vitrella brassicaformis CCMP3155]|eukprot:CEL97048.1 unnamed protein product [Vitrella brassicaformis CCMP3155]
MACVDRTAEFFEITEQLSSHIPHVAKPRQPGHVESHFNVVADEVGREIHTGSLKLQELAKLAKQRGIFNDKTAQIQELTYDIKQTITGLNTKIETLDRAAREGFSHNRHERQHATSIVEALKTRLLELTKDFKDILQLRTEIMKKQDNRRKMYGDTMASSSASSAYPFQHTSPEAAANIDMEGGQQTQLLDRGTTYHTSRAEAVENVQKVIGELAQIFQRVAGLVQEQDEMIRRIDDDVDTTLANVRAGQTALLDYFHRISSNRGLILKIFLILVFFVVFFVIFLA